MILELKTWWWKRRWLIKRDGKWWLYLNPGVFQIPFTGNIYLKGKEKTDVRT